MSNATKSLLGIFVVLLAATVLVKWLGNPSASEAFRKDIMQVDTSAVDRLVIETPASERTIRLRKENSLWRVSENDSEVDYPADNSAVKRAINRLNELEVKAVATRDTAKYTRFKVDSTGTRVSLYDGDRLLSGIYIGAPQFVSRREFNSYVRPEEETAVYTVEGFLGSTFNRELDGWRDKQVWDVEDQDISRIDFLFPADSSYSIERADDRSWISDGDTLESGPVSTIVSRLSSLRASGFVDSLSVDTFGPELYAIQVRLSNGAQKTVRLRLPEPEASQYHAVASEFPYVFTIGKSSWDNSVLKSRDGLLKE